jgi:hypothetical protein
MHRQEKQVYNYICDGAISVTGLEFPSAVLNAVLGHQQIS